VTRSDQNARKPRGVTARMADATPGTETIPPRETPPWPWTKVKLPGYILLASLLVGTVSGLYHGGPFLVLVWYGEVVFIAGACMVASGLLTLLFAIPVTVLAKCQLRSAIHAAFCVPIWVAAIVVVYWTIFFIQSALQPFPSGP